MKNISKKQIGFVLALLLLPILANATTLENPLGSVDTVHELVGRLVKFLLRVAGSVSLLMFVWGGFQYLWSGGDDAKVKKGKETLKNALFGIFIIFFSYSIVNAIINILTKGSA